MHPIYSISGYPGSGKSTLCQLIHDNYGFEYISYDDFEGLTSLSLSGLDEWIKSDMPLDALRSGEFTKKIKASALNGPVVIESPLGPLHLDEGITIDVSIWLEVSLDTALLRAMHKILMDEWGSVDILQDWFSGYKEAYETFVRRSLLKQRYQVGDKCDIVLDASSDIQNIFAKAESILDIKRFTT